MGQVRVERVDRDGLHLAHEGDAPDDVVVDVLLDDRRVWSFWVVRDSDPEGPGRLLVPWARSLRRFLDGVAELAVVEHVSGRELLREEHRFGSSSDRVAVVDSQGRPLAIDKSGAMAHTFDTRSAEHVGPLLDAVEQVFAALREAGIDAFLAYGSLLGAVREGRLIGHDSDADLGYVSRHHHPVDVARESFELQRRLTAMGFPIYRYSGAAFRIDVQEADGSVRGLDLFGGFLDAGKLFLMGEVGHPFREEWVRPLTTATLEGRTFPVPAEPEHLLEAMYGPSWRVPDPAYSFSTPVETQRALNGWFRGTRVHRADFGAWYAAGNGRRLDDAPSDLARDLLERQPDVAHVVEVGAGSGADALWLARQGIDVAAYDYLPGTARRAVEHAEEEGLALTSTMLNLLDLRSTLSAGAVEARRPGPTAVLARHVADCTTVFGRESLWRVASMALRRGGHLLTEHWVDGGEPQFPGQRRLRTRRVVRELEERGFTVVATEERTQDPAAGDTGRTTGRVVAQWQR